MSFNFVADGLYNNDLVIIDMGAVLEKGANSICMLLIWMMNIGKK